jgi:hypothetical protein
VSDLPAKHMPSIDCSFDVLGLGTRRPSAQDSASGGFPFRRVMRRLIDVSDGRVRGRQPQGDQQGCYDGVQLLSPYPSLRLAKHTLPERGED